MVIFLSTLSIGTLYFSVTFHILNSDLKALKLQTSKLWFSARPKMPT